MICGLPPALSVSDSVPVRAPEAVGVKVTLMVQVPPAAKVAGLVGQALAPVLVAAKSPEGANERSEEHTSELQSRLHLVCRLLLEKKKPWIARSHRSSLLHLAGQPGPTP